MAATLEGGCHSAAHVNRLVYSFLTHPKGLVKKITFYGDVYSVRLESGEGMYKEI